jgi:hypothetical protein
MPTVKNVAVSLVAFASMANGLAIAKVEENDVALQKREPVTATIIGAVGSAVLTAVVEKAVSAAAGFIGDIASFDSGREAFTQQTTQAMFDNNPDPARFQAAACYNQAFDFADPANVDGQTNVKFSQGLLNTE